MNGKEGTPRAIILSTGSEITQGLYTDTNAMELSRLLKKHGFRVVGHAAAPDDAERIEGMLRATFGVSELVIITGGLGPTADDLNREVIARVTKRGLRYVHRAEAMMRAHFTQRGRTMPEGNRCQAFIPEDSICLLNFWGTAPGFIVPGSVERPMIVALPGVPVEWRGMMDRYFERHVLPAFPNRRVTRWTTLGVVSMPESEVNALLADCFNRDPRVEVGLLAQGGIISVRLLSTAETAPECEKALQGMLREVLARLPKNKLYYHAEEPISLEERVIGLFRRTGRTVALAESCTGGGVARRLTAIPGSSDVLVEGIVSYSNESKMRRLGVSANILRTEGAVSEACVREMAEGVLRKSGADVALSVSGIAGPGGGTEEKPVGLVWFGLSDANGRTVALRRLLPGDREGIRSRAELQALDMLRRWATDLPVDSDEDETTWLRDASG